MNKYVDKYLTALFEELVPPTGAAATQAGEIVRAANRIGYRYANDGDMIGIEYGKETCNPAARFLAAKVPQVETMINDLLNDEGAYLVDYEETLDDILYTVCEYLEEHPELKTAENTEDYNDYRTEDDVDDYEEEEEEWY